MNRDHGFTLVEIIVVIALLAMVGGGVYVWQNKRVEEAQRVVQMVNLTPTPQPSVSLVSSPTPTQDPMGNWKTYTDKLVSGFSFTYPGTWNVMPQEVGGTVIGPSDQAREGVAVLEGSNGLSRDASVDVVSVTSRYGVALWKVSTKGSTGVPIYISQQPIGKFNGKDMYLQLEPGEDVNPSTLATIADTIRIQ